MKIFVRTYGLLGELLKKPVPQEVVFERPSPVTIREILEAIELDEGDINWLVVEVDGVLIREKDFDLAIEADSLQIEIYPLFAGG
jgi:hypothetical protein